MVKKTLIKTIASATIITSIIALNPIGASAEWKENGYGIWFYMEGNTKATGWREIDGKWYYFDKDGYMKHDDTIDGYYLDSSGAWSTNTLDEQGRYKEGTVVNLSGTIKTFDWTHPNGTKFHDYALELDTPANFNLCTENFIHDGRTRLQILINNVDDKDSIVKKVNQHVNLKGKIMAAQPTAYYWEPVVILYFGFEDDNNESNIIAENINTETVTFADKNLEHAIRDAINKPIGTLYKSDVEKITELKAFNKHINDISGIENLVNLRTLELSYNQISDISKLKRLINLQTLNLENNKISDVTALKELTNLNKLILSYNQISDSNISSLKELTNLQTLFLDDNKISDISDLKKLTNLKELILNDNQVADISTLKELTNLQTLCLDDNKINNTDRQVLKKALPDCDIYYLDGSYWGYFGSV